MDLGFGGDSVWNEGYSVLVGDFNEFSFARNYVFSVLDVKSNSDHLFLSFF